MTRKTMRTSEIKAEMDSVAAVPTVPSNAHFQISDSDAFDLDFLQCIQHTYRLKRNINVKFIEYEKRLTLETDQRHLLTLELQNETEKRRDLVLQNRELVAKIATLTDLNDNLLKQNDEMKKEFHSNEQMKSEMNELNKKYQMLLQEKLSFRKNFKDRLKHFINDVSFSVADSSDEESSACHDNCQESAHANIKRTLSMDSVMSSNKDVNPTAKRPKNVDVDSADSGDSSSDDCLGIDEPDESADENQMNSDYQIAEIKDDPLGEDATTPIDESVPSPSNVKVDPDLSTAEPTIDINDCLAVVLHENPIPEKRRNFRRNIQKVMDFENLTAETKIAFQREKERKKRYARRMQMFTETYATLPGELNRLDDLLLDFDADTKRELLTVDKRLSSKLKPHQCEGVKFMWDACFESIDKLQHSPGTGCILSHCMGLGKTLQVITLVHTLLTNSRKTKVTKVLIICPVNVILNWVDEFDTWLKEFPKQDSVKVYELITCSADDRTNRMKMWHRNGGVFIIGYKMYQLMYQNMQRKKSSATESYVLYNAFIDPGADLVVCDEGHLLKNPSTQLSVAVNKIRTLRRIVLTGTPLQNNLKEYFSMVEFVKPRLLGTEKEFSNRFIVPIVNGQFVDSTDRDITLMKHRAYLLHKLLEGCVHRRDYSVLSKYLPPKQEYVLFIRLTKEQIALYTFYMNNLIDAKPVSDLPAFKRICNHPKTIADFIQRNKSKVKAEQDTESGKKIDERYTEWWKSICHADQLEMSNKMLILTTILRECEARDEKLIVFSGCLSTLNVIEHYLGEISKETQTRNDPPTGYKGIWMRDVDYSRLDGTQSAEKRKRDVTRFNLETNPRTRLFLISTKAGGLGINLMAANRVIIFDASWNPSDDIQSIFRTYRIGQKKECFIYRFVALGTMEEKIYDRQVSKLSISKRVIDEHQIGRHYKEEDLQQLYCIDNLDPPAKQHASNVTGDALLNSILRKYSDIVYKHHDHDSLLENLQEETVTDDDVGDIWDEF